LTTHDSNIIRIAMWSGPRNISTALMRAWENRSDTAVWDEPLYASYLHETGLDHPLRKETLASHETDWRAVIREATEGPSNGNAPIFYQKHMAHHLLPDMDRSWLRKVINCFLIRNPREVLLSYRKKRAQVSITDLGVIQQSEIYHLVCSETDQQPPIVDAKDILMDPEGTLTALCGALGIAFDVRMLSWRAGKRDSDGAWADHWYEVVRQSTGFAPYSPRTGELPLHLEELAEECDCYYRPLYQKRIQV